MTRADSPLTPADSSAMFAKEESMTMMAGPMLPCTRHCSLLMLSRGSLS